MTTYYGLTLRKMFGRYRIKLIIIIIVYLCYKYKLIGKIFYYFLRHNTHLHFNRTVKEIVPVITIAEKKDMILASLSSPKKYEIMFNISGFKLVHQMGFAKALLELSNHEKLIKTCKFSGISGGSATSAYLMASLYGIADMDYWYYEHV